MRVSLLFIVFVAIQLTSCQYQRKSNNPAKAIALKPPLGKPKIIALHPAQHDSISVVAVGDIMLGTAYPSKNNLPPNGAKNSFKNAINQLRSADLTFGNLEGTLLNEGPPMNYKLHFKTTGYLFRMRESYGKVLQDAGFKVLSLANNHIGDFGDAGRTSTMRVLDSLGIQFGGLLVHPVAIFEIKGITYGFCAFAASGLTLSIFDMKTSASTISELKRQCDIVIVSFHGGAEGSQFEHVPFKNEQFNTEWRGDVHAFAHNAIDAGADLVFGNGPHVSRAMELYKKRLIDYSLGNFCTYRCVSVAGVCGYAPLLKVYVNRKGEFLKGHITSYKQTHNNGLEADTLNRAVQRIKALTATDFPQSGLEISDDGEVLTAGKD
jgi:hypothetical protein